MKHQTSILINQDALDLDNLFLNENWKVNKLIDRIYTIDANGKELNWLVKTYKDKEFAEKESNLLTKLKKIDHIPKLLATNFTNGLNYIIISRARGKDLYDHIIDHGAFEEEEVRVIAVQLFTILSQMHDKGVIHKDIKPENIIYDEVNHEITLIDFEQKYTENYRSPEHIKRQSVTEKTDIWSAGVTLYVLASAKLPFSTPRHITESNVVMQNGWTENFKDFIRCLLEKDPDLRYDAEDALNHIWMTE